MERQDLSLILRIDLMLLVELLAFKNRIFECLQSGLVYKLRVVTAATYYGKTKRHF
jgi:hypothetical protein